MFGLFMVDKVFGYIGVQRIEQKLLHSIATASHIK